MHAWPHLYAELVARGAMPHAHGLLVRERGVRLLIRHTTIDGCGYLLMLVPVAPAASCDPARLLVLATQLVIGLPIVSSEIVSLRYTLDEQAATLDSIQRAVTRLVNDMLVLHAAIGRPAAPPDAFTHYAE